jgi:hypothetical protein
MVALLLRWEPLGAVAHFGDAAATVMLPWMLSVRGHKGKSWEGEGGGGCRAPWWSRGYWRCGVKMIICRKKVC